MSDLDWMQKLTLQTGILCCPMSEVYDAIETLTGQRVYTHEIPQVLRSGVLDVAMLVHEHGGQYRMARSQHPVDTAREAMHNA